MLYPLRWIYKENSGQLINKPRQSTGEGLNVKILRVTGARLGFIVGLTNKEGFLVAVFKGIELGCVIGLNSTNVGFLVNLGFFYDGHAKR